MRRADGLSWGVYWPREWSRSATPSRSFMMDVVISLLKLTVETLKSLAKTCSSWPRVHNCRKEELSQLVCPRCAVDSGDIGSSALAAGRSGTSSAAGDATFDFLVTPFRRVRWRQNHVCPSCSAMSKLMIHEFLSVDILVSGSARSGRFG